MTIIFDFASLIVILIILLATTITNLYELTL